MVDKLRDAWFRWRHRKSRAEVVAFTLGLRTGRQIAHLTDDEINRITNEMMEDY